MKLEVGMYVRTKYGISKIDENRRIEYGFMHPVVDILKKEVIIKASHNIIDLVEKNDFVNGHRVIEVDRESLELYIENSMYGCGCETINGDRDIKSIVTKEQMEAMQYKVVEE